MSDTEPKTISAKALRDFTDAGTERRFTSGKPVELTEGEFANYEAAGLVEKPKAVADAEKPAATSRTRS